MHSVTHTFYALRTPHLAHLIVQNKNSPEGLVGTDRRFVQFGGGASQRQLAWIRDQIKVWIGNKFRKCRALNVGHEGRSPLLAGNPVCLIFSHIFTQDAARHGQKVLMCCHLAFCPGSSPNACLLWNYEEMLEVSC